MRLFDKVLILYKYKYIDIYPSQINYELYRSI